MEICAAVKNQAEDSTGDHGAHKGASVSWSEKRLLLASDSFGALCVTVNFTSLTPSDKEKTRVSIIKCPASYHLWMDLV